MGANMVEKTITENRSTRSVEHIMSLEPKDMRRFVEVIREIEIALGNSRRFLSDIERTQRNAVRRSIYVARDLPAGHILCEADIDYRRPGTGILRTGWQMYYQTAHPGKNAGQRLEWGIEMTLNTIAVVDFGMGNLRSVQNAVEHVGGHFVVVNKPNELNLAIDSFAWGWRVQPSDSASTGQDLPMRLMSAEGWLVDSWYLSGHAVDVPGIRGRR